MVTDVSGGQVIVMAELADDTSMEPSAQCCTRPPSMAVSAPSLAEMRTRADRPDTRMTNGSPTCSLYEAHGRGRGVSRATYRVHRTADGDWPMSPAHVHGAAVDNAARTNCSPRNSRAISAAASVDQCTPSGRAS